MDKKFKETLTDTITRVARNHKIEGTMIGFETANSMLLKQIEDGKSLEDLEKFIRKNCSEEGLAVMRKIVEKKHLTDKK